MKMKKMLVTLGITMSVITTPLTVFAAHTHTWGATAYYGYEDEKPLPWENKCVTRHVYNYHQCLSCGYAEAWEAYTYEMEHYMVNGICKYCGMGYAR